MEESCNPFSGFLYIKSRHLASDTEQWPWARPGSQSWVIQAARIPIGPELWWSGNDGNVNCPSCQTSSTHGKLHNTGNMALCVRSYWHMWGQAGTYPVPGAQGWDGMQDGTLEATCTEPLGVPVCRSTPRHSSSPSGWKVRYH